MMDELIRKMKSLWHANTPEDVALHVEDVEERLQDNQHDLVVLKQRTDTLHRLVSGMRGDSSVP